jgi:hypothetical protein
MFFRRMRKAAILGLVTVATLGVAGCRHGGDPAQRAEHVVSRISSKLSLNDTQKAKLNEVKDEVLAMRKELQGDRQADFDTLIEQVEAKEADATKLREIFDARQALFQKRVPQVIAKLVEFQHTLDDNQKKKAADALRQFRSHMEKFRKRS